MPSLLERVHPEWLEALNPVKPVLMELEQFIGGEIANHKSILPASAYIMRAFERPLKDVRVLVVGQDPYPTAGHAMGLAFSVEASSAIPRSLSNIFTEMASDVGCKRPSSGDLRAWSDQGVMLLNRVLTVEEGKAGSHQGKGWERVTECAIDALVARKLPLVAVLWGRQAQSLSARLGATPTVMSAHPSPLSASQGFFGSRPFTKINSMLVTQGANPVGWCLP